MPQSITWQDIQTFLIVLGVFCGVGLAGAVVLLVLAFQQIKDVDVPEDADFFETLQLIPITVPLALDFLDLAFDVFSAPISWVVLEMLGLRALQMVTVFESLVPGTQLIPTLTICWFVAKGMKHKDKDTPFRAALRGYQAQTKGQYGSLARGATPMQLANKYRGSDLLPSGRISGRAGSDPLDGEIVDDEPNDYQDGYQDGGG